MSDFENDVELRLVKACLNGERAAQKQLYEQYSRKMMPICIRYSNDYETAKDMLHDGFVKVFVHLKDYKGEGSFEGWMRRIFVNTALENLRKNADRPYVVDINDARELSARDYSVLEEMSADEIMKCIQQLPEVYRAVFNMFAVEGYSHREIAEALNLSESSSRVYLTRAKQMLQKILEAKYRQR